MHAFMIEVQEKRTQNFFFLREFQFMVFAPDNYSLSSDQDTNQFLL